jgi:hypothetical protein
MALYYNNNKNNDDDWIWAILAAVFLSIILNNC